MGIERRGTVRRDLRALWNAGAIADLPDSELLKRFLAGPGETAELAFEAILARHGPMVLGTCRRLLGDGHDVEDAFQATFLILVRRAGSLRVRDTLGPWLHEVAHRVALEAGRSLLRRREREDRGTDAETLPARAMETNDSRTVIDEEISRLSQKFRVAVLLCDLEGMTIEAAAGRIGCPSGTVRSRLARGRERLRERLSRRGLGPDQGWIFVGPMGVPENLAASTARLATLSITSLKQVGVVPAAVSLLVKGVLQMLLWDRVKSAAAIVLLITAISAGVAVARRPTMAANEGAAQAAKAPAQEKEKDQEKSKVAYQMVGSVRVEGTDDTVAGAKINVLVGDGGADRIRKGVSQENGQFVLDLPPGQARAWVVQPPVGYWAPQNLKNIETFVVSRREPIYHKDYRVRRGMVWRFALTMGDGQKSVTDGDVGASTNLPIDDQGNLLPLESRTPGDSFTGIAEKTGLAYLTLPVEGNKVTVSAYSRALATTKAVFESLEWTTGFRPQAVRAIERQGRAFRLTDDTGKTAELRGSERMIPVLRGGEFTIQVSLPEPNLKLTGKLTGKVVDRDDHPLEGVLVALVYHSGQGSGMSGEDEHVKTDKEGRFLFPSILRMDFDNKPIRLSLRVTKDGYAGIDSRTFLFQPGEADVPQAAETVRLEPGVSLSGRVLDDSGSPVAGAWISPGSAYALRALSTRTDEDGRFTIRNLPKDLIRLSCQYGKLAAEGTYLADGGEKPIEVRLRPFEELVRQPKEAPKAKPLKTLKVGEPAPDLEVAGWSDGKPHGLADYRGKVIHLDFWGIWCSACINELPVHERLQRKFEPRDVVFLSVHTPDKSLDEVRKYLEFKKISRISAVDAGGEESDNSKNGSTANRYGVRGYPTFVLIDREGKIAFNSSDRSNIQEKIAEMKAMGASMGFKESTMTLEQFGQLQEAFFGREIEKVLGGSPEAKPKKP